MKGRTYRYFNDALFPFGYGLSYTAFELGSAQCSVDGNSVTITLPVTNTGKRDGTEIVQVYVKNPSDPNAPLKTLRTFLRVDLKAGQTKTATLKLERNSFEFFDAETNTMRVKPGQYEILVGNSSNNKDLKKVTVINL
jgi:beta-glucosidase